MKPEPSPLLDLDQTTVTEWFQAIRPVKAGWPQAVRPIETASEAPVLLRQLGDVLSRHAREQPERLAAVLRLPELRRVLAQLGAARLLRILSWLSESGIPDAPALVAQFTAGPSPEARALRAVLAATGREQLRERLFGADRVTALADATKHLSKEEE